MDIMQTLENHYRDLCDIEFTIERGKLWMLQTRVGKRTAAAAFRIATQLVDQGLIDMDEALTRVTGDELAQLMFPRFDTSGDARKITTGVSASPGAAVGKAVFDSATAVEQAAAGEAVILVRRETNPDDLHGMIAAKGILTSRGGKTSHAAVVARGMGKTCVCGAEELEVDTAAGKFTAPGGVTVTRGRRDLHRRHQRRGLPRRGAGRRLPGRAVLRGRPGRRQADELVSAVDRIMTHADERRRLGVLANADTGDDCARARRFGAERRRPGPDRAHVPRRAPPAGRGPHPGRGRRRAGRPRWTRWSRCSAATSWRSWTAMDGLPVTIRLIDPPLHEFLPDLTDMSVKVALAGDKATEKDRKLLDAVRRLHEQNPMLGLRGVRLGLVIPGLFDMQVRAIAHAAAAAQEGGQGPAAGDHDPADRRRSRRWRSPAERPSKVLGRGRGGDRHSRAHADRHDDRGAAGRDDRRRDRRSRPSSSRSAPTT